MANKRAIPANTHISTNDTLADLLHSWAVLFLGVKCNVTWRLLQMDEVGMRQPVSGAVGGGNSALQGPRLVMRDTVHLFDPGARHHHVLATEGTATTSPGTVFL